jgi:hypothetical protein
MILMWLGSFVLLLFGLNESQKVLAHIFSRGQKDLLEKNSDKSLVFLFSRYLGVVLLEGSPVKSLYSGMAAYNLRVSPLPSANLWMGLSTLGAWWPLLLGSLFLNVNGLLLLGIGALSYLGLLRGRLTLNYLKLSLYVGIFLLGGDLSLRNSSVLLNLLGTGDVVFFLADGRLLSVLGIMAIGVLLSLFVSVEFWSVCLALTLLVANVISVNGALALFAGERIGRMLLFWWRSRELNQDCRRIGWQFSLVSASGVFLGFMIAGILRGDAGIGFTGDMDLFRQKILEFLSLSAVILVVQFLAQMVWGHFGSKLKVDEIQEIRYLPKSWTEQELFSSEALIWIRAKVQKRLSEIRYHRQGLQTMKEGQIPEVLQARLKAEEDQLSRFLQD